MIRRLLNTAVAVFVVAAGAGCGGQSINSLVSHQMGVAATCKQVGVYNLAGKQEPLYVCGQTPAAKAVFQACIVIADGKVYDVTQQAALAFRLQHVTPNPCS